MVDQSESPTAPPHLTHSHLPERTMSALIEASATINASLELPVVLDGIARSAAMVLRAEASSVLMLEKRRDKLVFLAAFGDRADTLLGAEFDSKLGIAGHVASTGRSMMVLDVAQD